MIINVWTLTQSYLDLIFSSHFSFSHFLTFSISFLREAMVSWSCCDNFKAVVTFAELATISAEKKRGNCQIFTFNRKLFHWYNLYMFPLSFLLSFVFLLFLFCYWCFFVHYVFFSSAIVAIWYGVLMTPPELSSLHLFMSLFSLSWDLVRARWSFSYSTRKRSKFRSPINSWRTSCDGNGWIENVYKTPVMGMGKC